MQASDVISDLYYLERVMRAKSNPLTADAIMRAIAMLQQQQRLIEELRESIKEASI